MNTVCFTPHSEVAHCGSKPTMQNYGSVCRQKHVLPCIVSAINMFTLMGNKQAMLCYLSTYLSVYLSLYLPFP